MLPPGTTSRVLDTVQGKTTLEAGAPPWAVAALAIDTSERRLTAGCQPITASIGTHTAGL
jgi:hypothetical protein